MKSEVTQPTKEKRCAAGDVFKSLIFNMSKSHDWGKGYEEVDSIVQIFLVFSESIEHLTGSLGMADIGEFLATGAFENIVYLSWKVVVTQFLERVVVEALSVEVWAAGLGTVLSFFFVFTGMVVASIVSKPHIITCTGEGKRWCQVSLMGDPVISRSKKTVLQENNRSPWFEVLVLNPPDPESISVLGVDFMLFVVKTGRCDDLLPGHLIFLCVVYFPEVLIRLYWIPPQTLKVKPLEILQIVSVHKHILRSS